MIDSWLLAKLTNENLPHYGLEELAWEYLHFLPWKYKTRDYVADFSQAPPELVSSRCEMDAWASYRLTRHLLPTINWPAIQFVVRLAGVLDRIQMAGQRLDTDRLALEANPAQFGSMARREQKLARRLGRQLTERSGDVFDPIYLTNKHRLKTVLFDQLAWPVLEHTAKSHEPKLDKFVLQQMIQERPGEKGLCQLLLKWGQTEKLLSTYVRSFLTKQRDGFLYPNLFLGTTTWRRAGNNPNPQNLPRWAKQFIVSRFPDGWIGSHDFDQLEPRIMMDQAGQGDILERIVGGESIYNILAVSALWGHDLHKTERPEEYKVTKQVWLGKQYRMQARKLQQTLRQLGVVMSLAEVEEIDRKVWKLMPRVKAFQEETRKEVLETGQSVTALGIVRHLPHDGPGSPDFEHIVNEAINVKVQGPAAFITGASLILLEECFLQEAGIDYVDHVRHLWKKNFFYPLIQNEVHDELVQDYPPGCVDLESRVGPVMINPLALPEFQALWPNFTVPLAVHGGLAKQWR